MKFAISEDGRRIKVAENVKGFCNICGKQLRPHHHVAYDAHWAHISKGGCDPWWEESPWHEYWKNLVAEEFQEIPIEKNGVSHRADIRLFSGIVVELQHSDLSYEERCEREIFYENMIWVIHLPHAKIDVIEYCFKKGLYDDYSVRITNIKPWIYQEPHPCPIVIDIDDPDRVFHITEFDSKYFNKKLTIRAYGNFLDKKKFIYGLLKSYYFDLDARSSAPSKKHFEQRIKELEECERIQKESEERRKREIEEWRKKKEEEWRIEQEERARQEQERRDPKKVEELRLIEDNKKWGFL